MDAYTFRIILLGDAGVGKTSFLLRATDPNFNYKAEIDPTLEEEVRQAKISFADTETSFIITDTGGEERFRKMTSSYFRNANVALLLFDLTEPISFENIQHGWIRDCNMYKSDLILCLIGSKSDLPQQVSQEDIDNWSKEYNIPYLAVSYKEPQQKLEDLFQAAGKQMKNNPDVMATPRTKMSRNNKKKKQCLIQ